jgi:hypothetical protein
MYNSGKSSTSAKQHCTCTQLQYKGSKENKKSTKKYLLKLRSFSKSNAAKIRKTLPAKIG